ncbi:pseudouridylate synthase [Nitzschia inconspicua]|uniref:Pseudouridylate synthase n=1 Tax=Nitzschia inconspicua TaxID=303405 RepID=A0A9K3PB19_9STRA|nr:pseudouridylate synthase [Nitzschia inconspicua]
MTPSSRSYYSYYSSSSTKEEEEDDTTVPLHLLPNSLQFQRIHDDQNNKNNHHNTTTTTTTSTGGGSIHVTVRTDPLPLEEEDNSINIIIPKQQAQAQQQHQHQNTTTSSSSSSSSFTPSSSVIPDSVLQYQRQLRKVQANQRSLRPLTRCQHLRIVWEDEHLIVLNKPSGVLCVPGLNNKPNLLYLVRDYLLEQQQQQQQQQQTLIHEQEPSKMIVHRLDMDTSGIVVFAKTEPAMKELQSKFRNHDLTKIYHALLCGHLLQSPRLPSPKNDFFDNNNNDKNDDQQQRRRRQRQQHVLHIHLPLQRDPVRPPFMRVATPRSERYVRQVLPQLQSHGFQKLVLKRPKPSHTELRILRREYIPKTDADDTVGTILSQQQQQQQRQQRQQTAKEEEEEEEESENVDYDNDNDDTLSLLLPVTRVELIPHTGRTHQLRVHMAALGHAIVGDPAYGLYGEATPNGGVDIHEFTHCRNNNNNNNNTAADDDDEYYFSSIGLGGASIELQQQIWEAWSARGSGGSTITTTTTTTNNNNEDNDNSSNNDNHVRPMCLHAARLTMEHPITGQTMVWEAPTPF